MARHVLLVDLLAAELDSKRRELFKKLKEAGVENVEACGHHLPIPRHDEVVVIIQRWKPERKVVSGAPASFRTPEEPAALFDARLRRSDVGRFDVVTNAHGSTPSRKEGHKLFDLRLSGSCNGDCKSGAGHDGHLEELVQSVVAWELPAPETTVSDPPGEDQND